MHEAISDLKAILSFLHPSSHHRRSKNRISDFVTQPFTVGVDCVQNMFSFKIVRRWIWTSFTIGCHCSPLPLLMVNKTCFLHQICQIISSKDATYVATCRIRPAELTIRDGNYHWSADLIILTQAEGPNGEESHGSLFTDRRWSNRLLPLSPIQLDRKSVV